MNRIFSPFHHPQKNHELLRCVLFQEILEGKITSEDPLPSSAGGQ